MHREGADGLVVAENLGNAEEAKGSDSRAVAIGQPSDGEELVASAKPVELVSGSTVRAG